MRRTGLGRGLSALMDEVAAATATPQPPGAPTIVAIARIAPNPGQPRRRFEAAALDDLASSMREHGVLQPILVRAVANDRYEIVAGERRWRAAQLAGLHEMPVTVRELDDRTAFEIAIIENVQRADLNAIEEAEGYRRLIDEHGHTLEAVATAVGKSRPYVVNLLRTLELPHDIRQMVIDGRLSASHARAIIGHADAATLAEKAVKEGWSVRQMEAAVRKGAHVEVKPDGGRLRTTTPRDPNLAALEASVADALGTVIRVVPGEEGPWAGTVVVEYQSLDVLDMICQRLLTSPRGFEP